MALIDTAMASNLWIEDKTQLVQSLRLAVTEELSAATTYEKLAYGVKGSGISEFDGEGKPIEIPEDKLSATEASELAKSILEIADDELRHVGKLMRIIDALSEDDKRLMDEGRAEA